MKPEERKASRRFKALVAGILAVAMIWSTTSTVLASSGAAFKLEEATIADVHRAMEAGELTCRSLVGQYLAQIEAYDKQGPALNAIIEINPYALSVADALDLKFARGGFTGPMHCVPVIVKDNYNTKDMPTTGGSLSLKGFMPYKDAHVVKKLRDAGAVILAKSNLSEFANGTTTFSSLGGQTRNPYDPTRIPGGSSGGTGAAIAANMGLVGLGTETGRSVRGPAAYNGLVGLVPTEGLVSREGIIPLSDHLDRAGPITRTVEDAARMLDIMAGYDPEDPITVEGYGQIPDTYTRALVKDGLKGARLGVLRQGFAPETIGTADTANPEVLALIEQAIQDLEALGAVIVDNVGADIDLNEYLSLPGVPYQQKTGINDYLEKYGRFAPVQTFEDIAYSGLIDPNLEAGFRRSAADPETDPESLEFYRGKYNKRKLRNILMQIMAEHELDALIYPYNIDVAQKIGETMDAGNRFSPNSGLPAIVVPAGFTGDGMPVSLEFLGPAFSEFELIKFAYSYEQATKHRKPPALTPVK